MNVVLVSIFVDSTPYLIRYFGQVIGLQDALQARDNDLLCLWGEGDSTDHTRQMLKGAGYRIKSRVIDVTHGGQIYGSVVKKERFRQLASVGRKLFAEVPPNADIVLYAESDLIWGVDTALGLIGGVGGNATPTPGKRLAHGHRRTMILSGEIAVIAPPILLRRDHWEEDTWYDTFGFVSHGVHFSHRPPYHPANDGVSLLEMETVGSMLAVDAAHFRQAAATYDDRVLGGLCQDIRKQGGQIWFDPTLPPVIHE